MKTVYLVRHAQALYDPALDDHARPLTPTGHDQADRLVPVLRTLGIEEIHTSPYRRCLETIGPFARHAGLALNHVHDLRERAFTNDRVPDWASLWRNVWIDLDFAFPDGESSRQAQQRMHAAMLALVKSSSARTLAVSSHGNAISLFLRRVDARFTFEHACSIRNPDVLRVTCDGDALLWDPDFSPAALAGFATSAGTNSSPTRA